MVDASLIASNIKEGVSILGILGTFTGGEGSIQSGTASPDASGKLVFNVTGSSQTILVYRPESSYGSSVVGFALRLPSGGCFGARFSHSSSAWTANTTTTITVANGTVTCNDGSGFGYTAGTYNWIAI